MRYSTPTDFCQDGFCDGNILYYIGMDNTVKKVDCSDGWGTCVGYSSFGEIEAGFDCSGTESMIERCASEGANKIEVSACIGNERSMVFCIEDLKGNPMALPKYSYDPDEYENCEENEQICDYVDNAPVCKAAE